MFPLGKQNATARPAKADPAPSRWSWRLQRLMLTPGVRLAMRAGVPFCLALLATTIYLSDAERRQGIVDSFTEARRGIEERPEFMVHLMAIDGAEGELAADVRAVVPLEFPVSSFDLDLEQLRADVIALDGIKAAAVRIRPGGVLQVDVTPRTPVAVWRHAGGLSLIDASGARVDQIASRMARPDLPLIVGQGAQDHVTEALDLMRASQPIAGRLRGLVRIGERRWDLVLDREQRILLPETGAVQALERVIALEAAQEVLTRDVLAIDMRLGQRPTVRMSKNATEEWWQIRKISGQ